MRPLVLSFSAFGPYAGTQRLNFGELKGRSFFLIHGPTGAGKTTILDAMCFALYGDTSAAARDSRTVRSDHAELSARTVVEFDFAVGARPYRVRRAPEQERPKKRGAGTTLKAAEAELWSLDGMGEAKLLGAGWNEVTRRVETLLGFKSSQFRQVVLLPQGEFRKLLTADSGERQEIMQTLFKTELYRRIEEHLKAKAQALKKEHEERTREEQWILQEAGAPTADALRARAEAERAAERAAAASLATLQAQYQAARRAVTDARLLQVKFDEQAAAAADLARRRRTADVVDAKRAELERAQRAAALEDAAQNVLQLAQDEKKLADLYAGQAERAERLAAEAERAGRALAAAEGRETEREAVAASIRALDDAAVKAAALAASRREVEAAAAQAGQLAARKAELAEQIGQAQAAARRQMEDYQALLIEAGRADGCRAALERAEHTLARRRAWAEAVGRAAAARRDEEQGAARLARAADDAAAAGRRLEELQRLFDDGQAAVLAGALMDGAPCPVCGSLLHPRPARAAKAPPEKRDIEAQRLRLAELEQEKERRRGALQALELAAQTLTEQAAFLERELGAAAALEAAALAAEAEELRRRAERSAAAQRRLDAAKRAVDESAAAEAALRREQQSVLDAWQRLDAAWKAAVAVQRERQAALPEEWRDEERLQAGRRAALGRQARLKEELEEARRAGRQADEALTVARTERRDTGRRRDEIAARLQREREAFGERLTAAGFADDAAYAAARKPAAYREKLAERIAVFDREMTAALERARRATEAVAGWIPPDLAATEQAAAERQRQNDAALTDHARLTAAVEKETLRLERLAAIDRRLERVREAYGVVGKLAEVANGGNEHKLTFQRYVLGALLDDVAIAANLRLKTMSRGRYLLQRTMDRARKNAAGGLDLEVFDQYTGAPRGVGTLSGGEMFLASLALALGLADVVQAYAGGIHLDTILVDEGFGTLDPESLDFALKALLDLQKGGRLVGIISHVPELRERIDARLEVTARRNGSTACFQVG